MPARPRRAERRQLTALFCDLVDSVSLTTRLDPEDMMNVLDVYQAACDDIIAQHGGYVAKYMGDGVLAYFGYPLANEEDAVNAVRTGLALRDSISRLDLPPGVTLQTRIGIATGLVVVNDLVSRGEVREAGIIGETPNLAARLQSIAEPNGVVVASSTRRLTEGLFVYDGLGSVVLKGFAAPVEAFEAIGATTVASRSHARLQGEATPLFGRNAELRALLDCWARARGGQGQVVLLQGEPGIGKSRLTEALRSNVADSPHVQTTWYCGPTYVDSALHPVAEQLSRAAGFEHGDEVGSRRGKLAQLMQRYGASGAEAQAVLADLLGLPPEADSAAAALTPEKRKEVTLETLLGMMEALSGTGPALFVVEDVHWIDSTTLELLDMAVRRALERPWMILVTARPEFEPRWNEDGALVHLQLGRLDRSNAERICDHLGAAALLPPEAVRQIVARCDGVPLFVEEMTKSVLEAMALASTRDGVPQVAIPETLQDSLVARLDRLGPARRIASLGAAIGRRFTYDLLDAIVALPAAELRQALRDLTRSGLVERSGLPPASSYVFKHALIRDAAYNTLLKREREALHGQIATALRDRFPELWQAEPELLAYHLTENGAIAEAVPLWAAAGGRAASRAAHVEAVGHLQTALELLRRLPRSPERVQGELPLLLGLAVSLSAFRGYSVPEVATALAEARAICEELGDVAGLYAVLRALCNFLIVIGDPDAAEETGRRCAAIAEETGLPEHRIEGDTPLGYVLWTKGDLVGARRHFDDAMRHYQENDGPNLPPFSPQDPYVVSLCCMPQVLLGLGDMEGAERTQALLHQYAQGVDRIFNRVFCLTWLAWYDIVAENYARALAFAEEATSICEAQGYATYRAIASLLRAYAIGRGGDVDRGILLAQAAFADFDRLGILHSRCFHLGEIAGLHLLAGDTAAALTAIDAAIEDAGRYKDVFFLPALHRRRAQIVASLPEPDPAAVRAALREGLAVAVEAGMPGLAARITALAEGALAAFATADAALADRQPLA